MAGSSSAGSGRGGGSARARGTGGGGVAAAVTAVAAAVAAAAATSGLGSSRARDVVVLGDAVLDAVGELLRLLGAAVTLGAGGSTFGGVVDLLLVGARDLDRELPR